MLLTRSQVGWGIFLMFYFKHLEVPERHPAQLREMVCESPDVLGATCRTGHTMARDNDVDLGSLYATLALRQNAKIISCSL